jgi:hypothetical protein
MQTIFTSFAPSAKDIFMVKKVKSGSGVSKNGMGGLMDKSTDSETLKKYGLNAAQYKSMLIAMEWGWTACEKGMNIQETIIEFNKLMEKTPS